VKEIKLRAWDIRRKKMDEIDFEWAGLNQINFVDGQYEDVAEGYTYHLMQFVGVYDRNGREIYEGDIVTVDEMDGMYPVGFVAGVYGFNSPDGYKAVGLLGTSIDGVEFLSKVKIVGNIYENPELLK